jgi:hypothetical protein
VDGVIINDELVVIQHHGGIKRIGVDYESGREQKDDQQERVCPAGFVGGWNVFKCHIKPKSV